MSSFSQRMGFRPIEKALQREVMDVELRNRLWSVLTLRLWDKWSPPNFVSGLDEDSQRVEGLITKLWFHHFKEPVDTIPSFDSGSPTSYEIVRKYFFDGEWWEAYDLIEFLVKNCPNHWEKN